jgi:hypothetical protein
MFCPFDTEPAVMAASMLVHRPKRSSGAVTSWPSGHPNRRGAAQAAGAEANGFDRQRSVRPWCLKRRTSLIRRIDNLWVGIGLPHWLNEKPVARLSCRPKRPAPPKGAHDRLKSLLTIPRNTCSRCSEIRAHDPAKRAVNNRNEHFSAVAKHFWPSAPNWQSSLKSQN